MNVFLKVDSVAQARVRVYIGTRVSRANTLPLVVSTLAGAAILAEAVTIGRLLFSSRDYPPAPVELAQARPVRRAVDVNAIVQSHLFGVGPREAERDADVRATVQNLVLTATLAMSQPKKGFAILGENTQSAKLYSVGEAVAGGAFLQQVFTDHVILNRGGRLEKLTMPERVAMGAGTTGDTTSSAHQPAMRAALGGEAAAVDDTSNAPVGMEMFQLLPVFGARGSGARVGLPRNAAEFSKTGLAAGDIVTAVNGTPVHSAQGAADLLRSANGGRLTVTVQRGADTQQVQVESLN